MCNGAAVWAASTQGLHQQGSEGARRSGMGALQGSLVHMLDGEVAPQDLDKDLPKLPGGQVIKERV